MKNSVVQGPDAQFATGTMGKQPIRVLPFQGKAKKRLVNRLMKKAKPVGYRVQSPDMQEKTMMMGKQPVAVFPRLKGQR